MDKGTQQGMEKNTVIWSRRTIVLYTEACQAYTTMFNYAFNLMMVYHRPSNIPRLKMENETNVDKSSLACCIVYNQIFL